MWGFVGDLHRRAASKEDYDFINLYIQKITELDALIRQKFHFEITEKIIPYSEQIGYDNDDTSSSSSYEFQDKYQK